MTLAATPGAPLALGIDIGGTKTQALVLGPTGEVLAERSIPTQPGEAGIRRTVAGVSAALAAQLGVSGDDFTTVGLGIPGLVDNARGVVETAVNLQIQHTDLASLLAADFSAPVRVENDVKATALGAALALGNAEDLTYLNLGTGVAAAALTGGRLIRGARNGAGEVGHLAVDPAGELCSCGQRGCFETVLGGGHLTPRLAALGLDLPTLGSATRPEAIAQRDRLVTALATVLTLLVITYDSALVVLGGGVVRGAGWLRARVEDELRRRASSSPFLNRLSVAERLAEVPSDVPVAAIGAAVVGRGDGRQAETDTTLRTRPTRPR